jgi:hypothetical protein
LLNLASNDLRAEGTKLLAADVISDMGALSKLIFGGDKYRGQKDGEWQDIYPEPAMLTMGMTEADFSNKNLGAGGAIIIAAWLTHKDKGALSKLIFGGDYDINTGTTPEPATLEVGMTEANFSNKKLGAGGAFIISAWITHKDKGAMTSLNLASNCLCGVNEYRNGTFNASGNAACSLSNHNIP